MNEPRRHHYIPRFYLKRFADQKQRLRAIRRSKGKTMKVTVKSAAVEVGFYDVETQDGAPRNLVESLLGRIENDVALAFARLDKDIWPPSDADRALLALFVAVQIVRTPEQRFMFEEIADVGAKVNLRGMSADHVRQQLTEDGIDPTDDEIEEKLKVIREGLDDFLITTDRGFMWGTLLRMAATQLAPALADDFIWHLMTNDRRVLATSDRPAMYWVHEPAPFVGVGVGSADEIYMPIDSRRMLAITRDTAIDSAVLPLSRRAAKQMNRYLLDTSYEWVFHDPRVSLFDPDELAPRSRPAFTINNREIYKPGDSWRYLAEFLEEADGIYEFDEEE